MPRHIKVIQATEFIRRITDGKADIEKADQLLKDIADAGAGLKAFTCW